MVRRWCGVHCLSTMVVFGGDVARWSGWWWLVVKVVLAVALRGCLCCCGGVGDKSEFRLVRDPSMWWKGKVAYGGP